MSRAPWPFVPRPAVFPPLPRMPRATRRLDAVRSRSRVKVVQFHSLLGVLLALAVSPGTARGLRLGLALNAGLLGRGRPDLDEVRNPGDHPAHFGTVGKDAARARPLSTRGPAGVPRCFGLVPMRGLDLGDERKRLCVGRFDGCPRLGSSGVSSSVSPAPWNRSAARWRSR